MRVAPSLFEWIGRLAGGFAGQPITMNPTTKISKG